MFILLKFGYISLLMVNLTLFICLCLLCVMII